MKINKVWILVALLLVILFFRECTNRKTIDSLVTNIVSYSDTVKTYRNENGKLVAYNQTLVFESKKQLKAYLSELDFTKAELNKWKNISPAVRIVTVIELRKDTIHFKDTIRAVFPPFHFCDIDTIRSIFATIDNKKFILDSLIIPNTMRMIIGEKKTGLFSSEHRIEVVNTNPLIRTTNLGSYTVSEKKKWYQTDMFKVGVGIVAGYALRRATISY